jgi:hypothetical protein
MKEPSQKFQRDGFVIEVYRSKGAAQIVWRGESDSRNPGDFINPIMKQLVDDLRDNEITLDLSTLKYMNSATVAPLIASIKGFDELGTSVLLLFSDTDWQRIHVSCMRTIARTLKTVKVELRGAT